MCQPKMAPRETNASDCACSCCGSGPSFRRFFTLKENIEGLESYKDQLQKELAGVEERISEIENK